MKPAPGRALITGAGGQVGLTLQEHPPAGWSVIACSTSSLDVTQAEGVRAVFRRERPTVVFHTAAYTAVDAAESSAELAEAVNTQGTVNVAEAAHEVGARLVHVSTDFVFDGANGHPYAPDDRPNPLGVYGSTKLRAEEAATRIMGDGALIVRTAWVYSRHRRNFVLTMLGLMRERDEVAVVSDQIGTPTWARSLSEALWAAAGRAELHGILHWTDAGVASWYDFAVAVQEEALALSLLEREVPIRPIRTDQYPTAARRPAYSVLDKSAAWAVLDSPVRHWRQSLRLMLGELPRRQA